jgi:Fe-S-cluster containining protein
MIVPLTKIYYGRFGIPAISRVDTDIFTRTYFTHCMSCNFCHDSCCAHGADVDINIANRLLGKTVELEAFTGISREEWFTGEFIDDQEIYGGKYTRTKVKDGACVFLNRNGRGCLIHNFCLVNDVDFHELKPMICYLFPVTFYEGLLRPANEIQDNSLICLGNGPTLYQAAKSDILYYFNEALTAELDKMENIQ